MMKFIKGFFDYRFLLSELVKKGIRLKYRRSYLGILWSLLEPILTTIVLVIVFGLVFDKLDKDPMFPMYIIIARLLYTFYQNGTKGALTSIRKNSGMIKKVYVPKYLYPLSDVLFNFIIFLISLVVWIPVDIFCGIVPTWRIVVIIPMLIILLVLTVGSGLVLCTLNVFFRDIEYLWNVGLMIVMYCCAIFYPVDKIMKHQWGHYIMRLNPLYNIIETCRWAIIGDPAAYPVSVMGIAYTAVVSIVVLIIGLVLFRKNQDKFILHI